MGLRHLLLMVQKGPGLCHQCLILSKHWPQGLLFSQQSLLCF